MLPHPAKRLAWSSPPGLEMQQHQNKWQSCLLKNCALWVAVSIQIAICSGTDHAVSVGSVFLERKPMQWVDNSVTGLWKIFFNQNPASSENMY